MAHKYGAEVYRTSSLNMYDRLWGNTWFCREFAQRDIDQIVTAKRYVTTPLTVRIKGLNMRGRDKAEQEGMAKFASLLLPGNPAIVDSGSVWLDLVTDNYNQLIYPAREVYSLMYFYIKNLSVQMQDRVDFERVCKSLIKRKHQVFHGIPDQQLGTALYFFAHVRYPFEMRKFKEKLSSGTGPGTAMRRLADLEEAEVGVPVEAAKFYWEIVDEWCSLFKNELRYIVDHHANDYERLWYLPLLIQDVYARVYDGDGKFDGVEYSEDEW